MMELPESRTLAKQLNRVAAGKKILRAIAGHSPHRFTFYSGDPQGYSDLLEGRVLEKACAIAGQLELYIGDVRLVLSDGVNLRYHEAGKKLPAKHQMLLQFSDGSALTCTVQMYGGIHGFAEGQSDNEYYQIAKNSLSPLNDLFDAAYFDGLWRGVKQGMSAKAFLATEQRIPGLGNGVLQDILFHAGVNPKSRLERLGEDERRGLYGSVKETLCAMTEAGGRDTEKDLFGEPGGYRSVLSKNTLTQPCPACGGAILREAYLGGNVYYCPVCQPIKK